MTIIGIHEPKNQRAPTLLGFLLKCSLILFNLALNSNLLDDRDYCQLVYARTLCPNVLRVQSFHSGGLGFRV